MKAILVIDIPDEEYGKLGKVGYVSGCTFESDDVYRNTFYKYELRPLPEKLEDWQYADKYNRWGVSQKDIQKEIIGYNLCVDEITGESKWLGY